MHNNENDVMTAVDAHFQNLICCIVAPTNDIHLMSEPKSGLQRTKCNQTNIMEMVNVIAFEVKEVQVHQMAGKIEEDKSLLSSQ